MTDDVKQDPRAGTLEDEKDVLDVAALTRAFYDKKPDPSIASQRVSFGTSGHRGSAFDTAFNEDHIVAITQAICRYRAAAGIDGPVFLGRDTHAVSEPAFHVALEVLAGNGVTTMIDADGSFTPTPVISHAILGYNRGRERGLADGIVITPSHNPPQDGGFKYNPPHGGPAESRITGWIEKCANDLLANRLAGVQRLGQVRLGPHLPPQVQSHDYRKSYISDLASVVDLPRIAASGLRIGVDPLGGAAALYWEPLAQYFGINLKVTDATIDSTFRQIPRDWDGNIRMDCSSRFPMQRLLKCRNDFDIAFANDTDADRHGIVTRAGLMAPNDYLATCIHYLGQSRPAFAGRDVGKTVVSSAMIDRAARQLEAKVFETPVGFKWFVEGLLAGKLFFSGEESAGSSFLRRTGETWTTDKDGLIAGLLAAEMTAATGKTPDQLFAEDLQQDGKMFYARIDSPADAPVRTALSQVDLRSVPDTVAGFTVIAKQVDAPGNGAAIGGIRVQTEKGWFAARPSGTEDIVKLYAESFKSQDHLAEIQRAAKSILKL